MDLFKTNHPEDRTGGEIFAAHCVSYIHHLERELGHRYISIGAADGTPIALYSPAQLTAAGGAQHVPGARFVCDLRYLAEHPPVPAVGQGGYFDACTAIYDLTLERYIK